MSELLSCQVHEIFTESDGILRWKIRPTNRVHIGDQIGTADGNGRLRFAYRRRTYSVHVVIFAMHNGRWPSAQVDHKNGVKTDNRIENLREATNAQNSRNRKGHSATGYKGVSKHKRDKTFYARIMTDGKIKFLGSFNDAISAARAYDAAAKELHGEFALLNGV